MTCDLRHPMGLRHPKPEYDTTPFFHYLFGYFEYTYTYMHVTKARTFLMSNISYMINKYQNNSKHNWFRFLYVYVHVYVWRTKTYACCIYLKNWTCLMGGQGHPWWATFDRTSQCREMGTRLYVCMWICIYRHRYVNTRGNKMSRIWRISTAKWQMAHACVYACEYFWKKQMREYRYA